MSLKKVLGLELFPIEDAEIMHRLQEAFNNRQEVVEFCSGNRKVRVKVNQISPEGLMKDYQEYYSAK